MASLRWDRYLLFQLPDEIPSIWATGCWGLFCWYFVLGEMADHIHCRRTKAYPAQLKSLTIDINQSAPRSHESSILEIGIAVIPEQYCNRNYREKQGLT